jgi:hypothetical protein
LFLELLQSDDPFERDLGGRLLTRYGSNSDDVKIALTREYRRQLGSRKVRRLEPAFHDLADNRFILTCHLEAMSTLNLASAPNQPLLAQFLHDLTSMRLNYEQRLDKRSPRGELNPIAHPGMLPFLMRLIEHLSSEKHPPATLRTAVELLGAFGAEAKDALPALLALREKIVDETPHWSPQLAEVVNESIQAITGKER